MILIISVVLTQHILPSEQILNDLVQARKGENHIWMVVPFYGYVQIADFFLSHTPISRLFTLSCPSKYVHSLVKEGRRGRTPIDVLKKLYIGRDS